jgi:hypothetical protein
MSLLSQGIPLKPEGTDKKYISIRDTKGKSFIRNVNKTEANINP